MSKRNTQKEMITEFQPDGERELEGLIQMEESRAGMLVPPTGIANREGDFYAETAECCSIQRYRVLQEW
jgi:hypothetical protein